MHAELILFYNTLANEACLNFLKLQVILQICSLRKKQDPSRESGFAVATEEEEEAFIIVAFTFQHSDIFPS